MKVFIITAMMLFLSTTIFSQFEPDGPPYGRGRGRAMKNDRIEQLEKIKLIEALDLDEATMLKFFARRNAHREEVKKIFERRDSLYHLLDDKIMEGEIDASGPEADKIVQQLLGLEEEAVKQRSLFINSLGDILNKEQIVKFILFEHKFRHEMRKFMWGRRGNMER